MKAKALKVLRHHDDDLNTNVRGKRAFVTKPTGSHYLRKDFAYAMARSAGPRTRQFSDKIGRLYQTRFYDRP